MTQVEHGASLSVGTIALVQDLLNAPRGDVNYTLYTTSDAHRTRMQDLPESLKIPREQWFTHRNWRGRTQMPPYHVHFREEMQQVCRVCRSSVHVHYK